MRVYFLWRTLGGQALVLVADGDTIGYLQADGEEPDKNCWDWGPRSSPKGRVALATAILDFEEYLGPGRAQIVAGMARRLAELPYEAATVVPRWAVVLEPVDEIPDLPGHNDPEGF